MQKQSRSESLIKVVATGGIVLITVLLFLAFGVFGLKLLGAMASMKHPEVAAVAQTDAALKSGQNPPPPAENRPSDLAAAAPATPVPPAPAAAAAQAAQPVPPSPETQKLLDVGKTVFMQCAACHGPDGKTLIPGMAPNLAGSSIATGPTERPVAVVLNGIQPEGRFQGVMVPWKAMLSDEQIAGVLTYVRSSFGNQAPPITVGMVAHARAKYAGQVTPLKRTEVEAINAELPGQ